MSRLSTRIVPAVMAAALVHCSGGSSGSSPAPQYQLGGDVSGLAGSGLVLRSSLGESLPITADGSFAFLTKAVTGTAYTVTVSVQPSAPSQTCTVYNGTGTLASADVSNVTVACTTNAYSVGGAVVGLEGSGLVLKNGTDTVQVEPGDDPVTFTFSANVPSGASFSVSVEAQPSSPSQTCTVSGGTGTVAAGDVTTVAVNCTTDSFTIGGTVSGLAGTGLVLENGGEQADINANGSFAFATPVPSGQGYAVSVISSPTSPWQICEIGDGTDTGTVVDANITSVFVTCTSYYTLGGTVTGLRQPGWLTLQNGDDELVIDAEGVFTFTNRVGQDAEYLVTVAASPPTESCTVSNETGTIGASDVTDVTVTCTCRAGLDDCDGDAGNGCETPLDTIDDCGGCGTTCFVANGAPACSSGSCAIQSCGGTFQDCNGGYADGCESDTATDANHCGACDSPCPVPAHATATCASSTCGFSCSGSWGDCNVAAVDGCETNLNTSDAHCGGCNNPCPTGTSCAGGTCR